MAWRDIPEDERAAVCFGLSLGFICGVGVGLLIASVLLFVRYG